MSFNFPNNQQDGAVWVDDCGDTWIYNESNNSWSKSFDPSVVGLSPFVRDAATATISPRIPGDELEMPPGLIDISEYPLA